LRSRLIYCLAVALVLSVAFPLTAHAQQAPIRLSTSKWRVDPGDSYTLTWMERAGVNPSDADFILEESSDPHFRDKDKTQSWPIHGAHHKSLENEAAFSHLVRYYRIRATAWVRGVDGSSQNQEDVVSNVVRVTLVGTTTAVPVPSFADDPETPSKHSSKGGKKDDEKHDDGNSYPTAGRPDLIISKILLSPKEPKAGQRFEVHVVVRNVGVAPSTRSSVKVEILGRTFEIDVDPLKPQFSNECPLPPQVADKPGPITVNAEVDPHDRVTESREDNNTFSQTFPIAPADPKPEAKDDSSASH
jgi:hypothetical protein